MTNHIYQVLFLTFYDLWNSFPFCLLLDRISRPHTYKFGTPRGVSTPSSGASDLNIESENTKLVKIFSMQETWAEYEFIHSKGSAPERPFCWQCYKTNDRHSHWGVVWHRGSKKNSIVLIFTVSKWILQLFLSLLESRKKRYYKSMILSPLHGKPFCLSNSPFYLCVSFLPVRSQQCQRLWNRNHLSQTSWIDLGHFACVCILLNVSMWVHLCSEVWNTEQWSVASLFLCTVSESNMMLLTEHLE